MREARDIAAVSIPFATGIAAASLLHLPQAPTVIISAIGFTSMAYTACLAWDTERVGHLNAAALFLMAGMFSGATSGLFPDTGTQRFLHSGLFEGIPFRHDCSAPLLDALMTGDRSALPRSISSSFRNSGASHILALSGLHLGIIYLMISRILGVFGNGHRAAVFRSVLTVALCALYTAATGAGPSLVRALIFIILNELMKSNPSRGRNPFRLLLTALLIQLALKPSVITQTGFQLSYLAIAGILLISPHIEALYPGEWESPLMKKLWSLTSLSLSCQLTTAPLVWITFHTFPKYFLLSNLISLPLTEALMICGAATMMGEWAGVCPPLMVEITDSLAAALVRSMEIISSM